MGRGAEVELEPAGEAAASLDEKESLTLSRMRSATSELVAAKEAHEKAQSAETQARLDEAVKSLVSLGVEEEPSKVESDAFRFSVENRVALERRRIATFLEKNASGPHADQVLALASVVRAGAYR